MSLSLAEIDNRIAALNAEISSMAASLVDLDSDVTLKLLGSANLSGLTAREWGAVSPRLPVLWSYFGVLKDRAAQIEALRAKPRLKGEQIEELAALLLAETVAVPPDPASPGVRSLHPTERSMAIDALQAEMAQMFKEIVSVVDRVSVAWQAIPRLDAAGDTLTGLTQQAGQNGLKPPAEIAVARNQIGALREPLTSDPLSINLKAVDEMEATVESAKEVLRVALGARGELSAKIEVCAGSLDSIEALIAEAHTFGAEAAVKIAGAEGNQENLAGLNERLARVRANLDNVATLARSSWQESSRLLGQLDQQLESLKKEAQAALAAVRDPLDARKQLRGRLDAYRAKALAKGLAENAALARIYDRAHELLYTAPCDVAAAEAAVRQYQDSLNQSSTRV